MIDQEKDLKFMTLSFSIHSYLHFQGKNIPFTGYMQHLFYRVLRLGTITM